MNIRRLNIRLEVYKEILKEKDRELWMQGFYFYNAILVALDNSFGGKSKYFEKPIMELYEDESRELSEEEKLTATKNLFTTLGIMQKNFELNKK